MVGPTDIASSGRRRRAGRAGAAVLLAGLFGWAMTPIVIDDLAFKIVGGLSVAGLSVFAALQLFQTPRKPEGTPYWIDSLQPWSREQAAWILHSDRYSRMSVALISLLGPALSPIFRPEPWAKPLGAAGVIVLTVLGALWLFRKPASGKGAG